jgi:hypothetical protein
MTTSQNRSHFKFVVPSAYPVLIVGAGSRHTLFIVNEGADGTRIGFSGTVATEGMYMEAKSVHEDIWSMDEWWAIAPSSSGSISGYIVY